MTPRFHDLSCPYCGEPESVAIDPADEDSGALVTDCSVCCRPIHVRATRDGSRVVIEVTTEDRD